MQLLRNLKDDFVKKYVVNVWHKGGRTPRANSPPPTGNSSVALV